MNNDKIISVAKQTIETESKAILNLVSLVNDEFAEAVRYIYQSNGRVIITGLEKAPILQLKLLLHLTPQAPLLFLCMLQMPYTVILEPYKKMTV